MRTFLTSVILLAVIIMPVGAEKVFHKDGNDLYIYDVENQQKFINMPQWLPPGLAYALVTGEEKEIVHTDSGEDDISIIDFYPFTCLTTRTKRTATFNGSSFQEKVEQEDFRQWSSWSFAFALLAAPICMFFFIYIKTVQRKHGSHLTAISVVGVMMAVMSILAGFSFSFIEPLIAALFAFAVFIYFVFCIDPKRSLLDARGVSPFLALIISLFLTGFLQNVGCMVGMQYIAGIAVGTTIFVLIYFSVKRIRSFLRNRNSLIIKETIRDIHQE